MHDSDIYIYASINKLSFPTVSNTSRNTTQISEVAVTLAGFCRIMKCCMITELRKICGFIKVIFLVM